MLCLLKKFTYKRTCVVQTPIVQGSAVLSSRCLFYLSKWAAKNICEHLLRTYHVLNTFEPRREVGASNMPVEGFWSLRPTFFREVWQVFKKIKGDRDKMETLYLLSSPATSILSLRKQSSGKMERNLPRAKSQVRIFNLPGSVLWLPTSVREETKLETLTPLLISCKIFA